MLSLSSLRRLVGEEEFRAGEELARLGRVSEIRRTALKAEYLIRDGAARTVTLHADGHAVSDPKDARGRYAAAAVLYALSSGALKAMQLAQRRLAGRQLMDSAATALPPPDSLKMEMTLIKKDGGLAVGLRVGEERLYVVRDIPEFLRAVIAGESVAFGKGFTYQPRWHRFSAAQMDVFKLLDANWRALETGGKPVRGTEARSLQISSSFASVLMDKMEKTPFVLRTDGGVYPQEGVKQAPLPVVFEVSGSEKTLAVTAFFSETLEKITDNGEYILSEGKALRLNHDDRMMLDAIERARVGGRAVFLFGRSDVPRVMAELLPALMRAAPVAFDTGLGRRMARYPLKTRVYLDREGPGIAARTVMQYGPYEIDPFFLKEDLPPLLLRDAAGEKNVIDALSRAGFRVRPGYAYMEDEDSMYRFITDGARSLSETAQVFFSHAFRSMTVRAPRLTGRLTGKGGRLRLEVFDDGTPVEELLGLFRAIRLKKRYFRFKDGAFLSLDDTENWAELAEAYCEAEERTRDPRDLGMYRAAYLNSLIKEKTLPVQVDGEALAGAAVRAGEAVSPVKGLYAYQHRGFEWICSLFRLRMGGILADEMGLGKTVQTLAAMLWAHRTEKEKKPSIVVAPTSLVFNWLNECRRFAPQMRAQVLSGPQSKREKVLDALFGDDPPDVLITSYPILRQDIGRLRGRDFRFAVLDEAQNIKNPMSVAAAAVRAIEAECRLALSGTPMENNVGELWSLFDFALPGYLPPYRAFLNRYEDGGNADDLRRRIRPFLMRRLKQDVTAELPEKIEKTLCAAMTDEQKKVYAAAMLQKRADMKALLERSGLSAGRGEVLAAMTELRQICCHPRLVLDDFGGDSGKMELLMEILPPILENGHRVLLFSQFTRMLKMIAGRLNAMNIPSLYLDGDTPAKERPAMAERFNAGESRLFLISLKAGGTGLNLTGADTVIHFDPWWNPAAEEQAIDRAHRIGQDKKVQVVRLVTLDSIEEKVTELGQRKRRLFDKLITPGEVMPEKLTDKDILSLFEGSEG